MVMDAWSRAHFEGTCSEWHYLAILRCAEAFIGDKVHVLIIIKWPYVHAQRALLLLMLGYA